MIWKECRLIGKISEKNGLLDSDSNEISDSEGNAVLADKFDLLGNVIFNAKPIKTVFARFTPSDNTDVQLDGRKISSDTRKLLLRCSVKNFPKSSCSLEFEGKKYEIIEFIDLKRFVLLTVKKG